MKLVGVVKRAIKEFYVLIASMVTVGQAPSNAINALN
jgi:hypothetical protein